MDHQGGKKFAKLKKTQESYLNECNQMFLENQDYLKEYPNLAQLLEDYKNKFMIYDVNDSGDIDEFELKKMIEKLGKAKKVFIFFNCQSDIGMEHHPWCHKEL